MEYQNTPFRLGKRLASLLLVCGIACFVSLTSASAAEQAKKQFDIPADTAEKSLKMFSAQAGVEVLFSSDAAASVKTNAIKGAFTPMAAAKRMLEGTELYVRGDSNGVVRIARNPDSAKNVNRAIAETEKSGRPDQGKKANEDGAKVEDGIRKLAPIDVTGTRIRSLVDEQSIQPVLSISGEQIDRYGVTSLGELFRYIPQATGSTEGLPTGSGFGGIPGMGSINSRVTVTLRNASFAGTLLLVNGRRVPKTGQEFGNEGFDLSGIPISAIERVDVLLDGASAVYGSDAIGGVVNVILKKNYSGTEIRLGYVNTFDTDSGVRTASIAHGFRRGRLSGLLSASGEDNNTLAARDRWFIASSDRRPFGGADRRNFAFAPGGTGQVRSNTTQNLPGLGAASAAIPKGSNGQNLTVQDYANAGPQLEPRADLSQFYQHTTNYRRTAVAGSFDYDFRPWLKPFFDGRWSRSENWGLIGPLFVNNLLLPAGYPGNPFGVPIRVDKYFFDVPVLQTIENDIVSATLGVRGALPRDWRYEASASLARARPNDIQAIAQTFSDSKLNAAIGGTTPPLILYDSSQGLGVGPNPPGTWEALTNNPGVTLERSETWTYSINADGPVYKLPAGDIRMAAGAEYREEYADFPSRNPNSTSTFSARPTNRDVAGYFAELRVPIMAARQEIPLLNTLEISLALRHDRYSDFSSTTNPRYGALWRPVSWLMLRGSFGDGFKVPTLQQAFAPIRSTTGPVSSFNNWFDPRRNNESLTNRVLTTTTGGNPALRPETSANIAVGIVLEVPRVKGFSLSYDYYKNDYTDRVGGLAFDEQVLVFPEKFVRGPNLPGDPAGFPGPIMEADIRGQNIASSRYAGYDIGARYSRTTPWGEFDLKFSTSKPQRSESKATPRSAVVSTPAVNLTLRLVGSVFWNRGPWGTGAIAVYREGTSTLPSAVKWDWQGSYNFGASTWRERHASSWWASALAGTSLRLTVFNVFNTVPPNTLGNFNFSTIDARLRRYGLSLSKKF